MLASSAWGQPGPAVPAQSAPAPPSPAQSTGASPPVAVDPALAPPDPSAASPQDVAAQASAAFQRGLELQRDHDYAGAIVEFERAYDLSPAYQVLYYIGAMNVQLARWARARRAFEMYLELGAGQLSPQRISEVRVHLDALSKKTVTLTLMLNVPGAEVHIDGEPVEPTAIAGLVLDPGEHVVRASKPGFKPLEQVLRASDGENLRVVLPLARVGGDAPGAPPRVSVEEPLSSAPDRADEGVPLWVPWTLTGVLAAGWLTTAGLAIKARHDRDVIEQPGTPDHRIDDARRLHMTLAVVSDVLLVSTLASAGISAYLTWWPESSPSGSSPRPAADGLRFGVTGHF
jgi:hypothetical protein